MSLQDAEQAVVGRSTTDLGARPHVNEPFQAAVSDEVVRQAIIDNSIDRYSGGCPCPYNVDRGGLSCGGRSAYSRPGGAAPYCYPSDIPDAVVASFRQDLATR